MDPVMKSPPQSAKGAASDRSGSFLVWRIGFMMLCAVGMYLSADLLRLHVKVYTDPDYHAFCAVSEYLNCETVAVSQFAVFAGLPVALWGLTAYFFIGGLCIWGTVRRNKQADTWPFALLFWLSFFSSLVSVVLLIISHSRIQSLCLLCMAAYMVNFLLFGFSIVLLRQLKSGPIEALRLDMAAIVNKKMPFFLYVTVFAVILAVVKISLPAYWEDPITIGPEGLLVGQTANGLDWIGARKPVLKISEFSDYQCPHCRRGHRRVRSLVSQNPDRIRLVHRHFPLRSHKYSFAYSLMAHCAGEQDRFWEANDYLFKHGLRKDPVNAAELAQAIQIEPDRLSACMAGDAAKQAVTNDIAAGSDLKIRGTPSYLIGSHIYPGKIPEHIISDALAQNQKD